MSKFSDYINSNSIDNEEIKKHNCENKNKKNTDQGNMEELINKYSAYSESDLMKEFLRLTMEKKSRGELDGNEMKNLKQTIAPYLNDEQKNNLDKIMNMVDNVK